MKMTFRWQSTRDKVPLEYISQIPGMTGIVSAVYDFKVGELWSEESIKRIRDQAAEHGLKFEVVESIPVHEDIKLGRPTRDHLLDVYCENIRRCAKYGVKCVCYNFMPVFDWTRTQLDKKAADGSTSLVMYKDQLKAMDPLVGELSLPGWDASYTKKEMGELIAAYKEIGEEGLWENFAYFLKKVIPVAEEYDVKMAIHPDDPPYPIFGIPRIITCEENIDRMFKIVDSKYNGLTLCTGSLGCDAKNDIPHLAAKYTKMSLGCDAKNDIPHLAAKYTKMGRVHFVHMRNVKNFEDGSFEESGHLSAKGSLDMEAITRALVENGFDGYVRPDHGRMVWGEEGLPGYGLYDRALGAAYLNGLFEAVEKSVKR